MTHKIKARFTLQSIEQHATHADDECLCNVRFTAVTASNEDCKSWSKYTPNGELTMTITNPGALSALSVGQDYLLDISPAN